MTTFRVSVWEQILEDLRRNPAVIAAILAFATLLLYLPVVHHAFLDFDDTQYVSKNVHVRTGLKLDNVIWAFQDVNTFYWHPVTWLSHMTDCQIFGLNSGAHHLVNVAIHIANVLLLFFLLRRATGAVWKSTIVAALFALHPLNVETVAWLAERKSLLSAFFSFLTFAAYGWYAKKPDWKRYLLIVAAFLLALMSKPMAVTVPVLLLLFDIWPLRRYEDLPFTQRWRRLSLEKLPLLLMSAASSTVTFLGHRGAIASLSAVPFSSRVQNALLSYATYVIKAFWPAGLSAFYPLPEHPLMKIVAAAVFLLAATVLALRFHRVQYALVGWFFFVVSLLPVSGIIQVGRVARADRFTYIPCIGIFVIVVWASGNFVEAFHVPRSVAPLAVVVILVASFAASRYYLQFWHDGATLFTRARLVAKYPDPMIEEFLGDALASAGLPDDAFQHYEESCRLAPNGDLCHYNMAEYLFSRYRLSEAVQQYQLAASLTSNRTVELSSYLNAADALISMGDYSSASTMLSLALQLDPGNESARRLMQRLPR